ncbi:hypothetical protein [Roseateles sp. LYH14W]|uniref:Uncharacterized protein n=1 Tax=Pelomonas parva TaxID=3299032 RepID=A0ABW7EVP3_9BURK
MSAAEIPAPAPAPAPAAQASPSLQLQPNEARAAADVEVDEAATDEAAVAAFFAPPPRPADYQLPSQTAVQRGLQVDFAVEAELRAALHSAGVDGSLASSLYLVALNAAQREVTPLSVAVDYSTGERSLRQAWGDQFDANLQAANQEGRRLYEAMPDTIRRGMSYADYALAAGFANSAPIAKMLLARAQGRSRTSKAGR